MSKRATTTLALVAALFAPGAAAGAKLDAKDLKGVGVTITDFGPIEEGETGGGYVLCPPATRVVTGGAYPFPSGEAARPVAVMGTRISSSTAVGGGNGWYADAAVTGVGAPPATLRVLARCVPEALLEGAVRTQDTATIGSGESEAVKAGCPLGHKAFTGGSFWHAAGQNPTPANALGGVMSSSTPTRRGDAWYADGTVNGAIGTTRSLTTYAWCLPRNRLADLRRVEAERTINPAAVGQARCPRSHPAALAAGTLFHRPGSGPDPFDAGYLRPIAMGALESPRRFVAAGYNDDTEKARMVARGFCLAK